MAKELLMGNAAIGLAALGAGVGLVSGYPGTPSTEILETVAAHNRDGAVHVEWSTNEKAALEVAAGASYAGVRCLVTMKQVGLNVASDPLMSLVYVGVKGGVVLVVADDPGPISSQTEQDTRRFGGFAKLPVLDPSSPEEAATMVPYAFDLSERFHTPVILRPTTRICHSCVGIDPPSPLPPHAPEGFVRDSKWVIFPRRAYQAHLEINERLPLIAHEFDDYPGNTIALEGRGGVAYGRSASPTRAQPPVTDTVGTTPPIRRGIVTGGVSHAYALEALRATCLSDTAGLPVCHVATPYPFPTNFAASFLVDLDEVLVVEELDHVIEDALLQLVGTRHLKVTVRGKLTGDAREAGENTVESVLADLTAFLEVPVGERTSDDPETPMAQPPLPVRPPVLCAGCPHRASFYAVKRALAGRKVRYAGDIGCYTLGNAAPLDTTDTCLCMGAGITIAQGAHIAEPDAVNVAFVGDSTFFASGLTGVVNAVYNRNDFLLVVLDNSTTAMTGQQPHPGTGITMMGEHHDPIDIPAVLHALGVSCVVEANPFDHAGATSAVKRVLDGSDGGVRAVVFKAPCIAVSKPGPRSHVDRTLCTGCHACIRDLGCPALSIDGDRVSIEASLCYGCMLCEQVCPFGAIAHDGVPRTARGPRGGDVR